jgi:hypothetical protein
VFVGGNFLGPLNSIKLKMQDGTLQRMLTDAGVAHTFEASYKKPRGQNRAYGNSDDEKELVYDEDEDDLVHEKFGRMQKS